MILINNPNQINFSNTVVTVGIFDGVHHGHQKILKQLVLSAKNMKASSVVFSLWPHPKLFFDPDNKHLKFLSTINEKKKLMEQIGVDYLIIYPFSKEFSQLTACEFIDQILVKKLGAKKLIVGFNHKFGHDQQGNINQLNQCTHQKNFSVEKVEPYTEGSTKISSSIIRGQLLLGNLRYANHMLGYHYFIYGKVVGGSQIGRTIGFPTANIQPNESYKLIPKDGVYAVKVKVCNKEYNGMLNIGIRPTIDGENSKKSIEVHIIDFTDDLYNEKISVHFIERIRNERMFENVHALTYQLKEDRKRIIEILDKENK